MESQQTQHPLQPSTPSAYLDHLPQTFIGLQDILDMFHHIRLFQERVKITEVPQGNEIIMQLNGAHYIIHQEVSQKYHREDVGGEYERIITLERNNQKLLFSRRFCSYYSSLEDAVDSPSALKDDTYLIERDRCSEAIFRTLKLMGQHRQ